MKQIKENTEEKERLSALYAYGILDTGSEEIYDQLTEFAAHLSGTETAAINFLDEERLWVKSCYGFDSKELPRAGSFCNYALENNSLFEVPDTRKDKRFANYPQVTSGMVIFYTGVPLIDDEGYILGTLCVFDNKPKKLTKDQKKGLELLADQIIKVLALRKTRLSYELLIESSRDMIYELDGNGKFTFANTSTINRTGYSLKELNKITCWELVVEDQREAVRKFYIDRIKEGETSIYHEFPIQTRSGEEIWLGQSVDYIFNKDRMCRAYVVAKDITELIETRMRLKETEEQILAEKNLLKTMIFSSPAAIAMFNKNLRYLAFSEKWDEDREVNEQVIGLKEGSKTAEQTELFESIKERILQGEVIGKENDLVISSDGEERWIKWVATPWNNTTDGSIGGIIVYTDDVTRIVNHEAELQKAKEEALKSGKIKEDFLSSMSHEIRTPLNAIIGTANLLVDDHPDLADNEKFKLLKFSSNNLLALINNVLDYSKIESGNIAIENKEFEIQTLTSSLVNSWMPLASQKDLELRLELDPEIPPVVVGDAVRLSQVLNNLVNNALKFTEEGCVVVSIKQSDEGKDLVAFEVKDSGIGIPKEKQKSVFESFKQVTSHLTHQHGGTGLGLAICKKLVGMMGGDLELTSQQGFGSNFSFTISLKVGDERKINKGPSSHEDQLLDVHVLLVEDNKANQFIAKSFLEKWGATLCIANNGKEALDLITDETYDMVLLDLRMPVMDGYTCAAEIRKLKGKYYQDIPIIAMTASSVLDVRKKGSVIDFDDYLSKPFDPRKLHAMILKYATKLVPSGQPIAVESASEDTNGSGRTAVDIIDRLQVYTEGDSDFLIEFTQNIIDNMLEAFDELPKLFKKNDATGLGEMIHRIKPTAEIIGEGHLIEELYVIRDQWKEGVFDPNEVELIKQDFRKVLAALNDILESEETITA